MMVYQIIPTYLGSFFIPYIYTKQPGVTIFFHCSNSDFPWIPPNLPEPSGHLRDPHPKTSQASQVVDDLPPGDVSPPIHGNNGIFTYMNEYNECLHFLMVN